MPHTPFSKITDSSRRQHWVFFALIPVAILLAVGMYWGTQRAIEQEQRRFTLDFSTLVGYVNEQESFLRQLHGQNEQLALLPLLRVASFHEVNVPPDWGSRLFEGRESVVDMPFSLACKARADCPNVPGKLFALGSYLADFYSSFWASSYFPAAAVFFVNENDGISIGVPAVNVNAGYEPISIQTYRATTDAVRQQLQNHPHNGCQISENRGDITWFRTQALPDRLIGLIPAGFPPGIWGGTPRRPTCIYAATLLNRSRIGVMERNVDPAPNHLFWLQYRDNTWMAHRDHGVLIGEGELPALRHPGLHYTLNGLVLKVSDKTGHWTGVYRMNYSSFFRDNLWLPSSTILLLLISIVSCVFYMRWYNRRVILPAQEAQREILESDAFNRTLIQTAPVALCLIDRDDGRLVFANELALDWLGASLGQPLPHSDAMDLLLSQVLHVVQAGTIAQLAVSGERTLYVAYAPTRYMQQDVILCAFADVSSHAEMERHLMRARKAADEANEAKSTFLATMSHEIRTPLYGALGTLELLSLTELNSQQRQYVSRIEDASQMLLQIISDILDISKIEAGQLQLEETSFNPRELVQSCTGTYAGMAHRKGLLLFSSVTTDVPPWVKGDPTRLRQILNNLISNAIKFTESGYVIVRMSASGRSSTAVRLLLEVCDSGVGISKPRQEKLFTPFYLADAERNISGGAGLGLSICARLAELMNTAIQLRSEAMMGSKFFFELESDLADDALPTDPQLSGTIIGVRTPHPELTANICDWLRLWGAQAGSVDDMLTSAGTASILLEIMRQPQDRPADWPGQYLGLSLSGETGIPGIDANSVTSIGFGIDRLIHAQPYYGPSEVALPSFHLRILVAEDHPLNQVTLREQLERLGCEVTLADDGEEALALWDMSPYDMVLTDVNMPYLNGYELARKLRAEGVSVPIVGVTANAMRDEEQRCVAAGMNGWLVKPIDLRELVALLRTYTPVGRITERGENNCLARLEPDVLDKHRHLFLQSMWDDWHQLDAGITQRDAETVAMILHRMRSALVLAQQRELASRMERLEQQIQASGMDGDCIADVLAMAKEIYRLIVRIETDSIA